ncbi:diacylglycerol kinase family protein [Lapidilactobacillus wuchangensis]|uniref:diacylglycerol kinase family protein n=1 Tax=Lapidilactobacillus wuchangensis TaxID=2486001 RepID=UPI000F7A75BC|nr:diacylglycerol kinase family protein [Lapidilactobacillus wuchangensis]
MASNAKKPQTSKNHSFWQSFHHAAQGLSFTFQHEGNFKRHLAIATVVIVLSALLRVAKTEWLWLVSVIFIVLIAELWNTVVEYIVDLLVAKQYDTMAKHIKDVSAAIVLVASLLAVIVGLIIFVPYLWKIFA